MLKLTSTLFTLLCIGTLIGCGEQPQQLFQPELDKHYRLLPEKVDQELPYPVVEVFSLTCHHCMNLESSLPEIAQYAGTEIKKMHLVANQNFSNAAMLFYSAIMQNDNNPLDDAFMAGLFNIYHGQEAQTQEQYTNIIKQHFQNSGFTSPYDLTEEQTKQLYATITPAIKVSEKAKISSVPTFIVKGQYLVNIAAHSDAKSIGQTIAYLLNKTD